MNYEEKKMRIALSSVNGIGPKRFQYLLKKYYSAKNVFSASYKDLTSYLNEKITLSIKKFNWRLFDQTLSQLHDQDVKIVVYGDPSYPRLLKSIYDPPIVLYIKGNYSRDLFTRCITIVGTRTCSIYGNNITKTLVHDLVMNNFTIVSGMAFGIDTISHYAAIKANGKTVAVIPGNVTTPTPRSNQDIYSKIIESGCAISENLPPHSVSSGDFPKRNRILSGISQGTIVIEAPKKSGSLITAKLALEQNREVFAVPGDINYKRSKGTNDLIRNGEAKLIECIDDILIEFDMTNNSQEKVINPKNKLEKNILDMVIRGTVDRDKIIENLKISISEFNTTVSLMELEGKVERDSKGNLLVLGKISTK